MRLMPKPGKKSFGFVFHPLDLDLFAAGFNDHSLANKRDDLVRGIMKWFPPFKREILTGVRSQATDEEIIGHMILCTFLPEQVAFTDGEFILDKVVAAGEISEKLGDKIIGLGAYASQVGRKGQLVARRLNIPVTTGNSYTVAMAAEATLKAAYELHIPIKQAKVAIVGATGSIGRVLALIFAERTPHLRLVARNETRLINLATEVCVHVPKADPIISTNINEAISDADIILTSTSTPKEIIDVSVLKPGALICDISRPKNVRPDKAKMRDDILIIEGGIVKPPGEPDFHFSFGLPPGLAYACMAETMILAFENKYVDYSIGGSVTLQKVREIYLLGKKHGFELARLMSFDKTVTKEQILKVRNARTPKGQSIKIPQLVHYLF